MLYFRNFFEQIINEWVFTRFLIGVFIIFSIGVSEYFNGFVKTCILQLVFGNKPIDFLNKMAIFINEFLVLGGFL